VAENSFPVVYHFAVSDDPSFPYENWSANITIDDPGIPAFGVTVWALPDGVWYWRVYARDNAGNVGENSDYWTFRIDTVPPVAPVLVSPANGENTNDNTPTLVWSNVFENSLPVVYTIEVDNESTFSSPLVWSGTVENWNTSGTSSVTLPALADNLYYWRVRARDNAGNEGQWSAVWTFRVDTTPPAAPVLVSPANGENTNDNTPVLHWSNVTDNSLPVTYRVQVASDNTFTTLVRDIWVMENSWEVTPALPDNVYSWRVMASGEHRTVVCRQGIQGGYDTAGRPREPLHLAKNMDKRELLHAHLDQPAGELRNRHGVLQVRFPADQSWRLRGERPADR
jgi:hypothetical protein